MIFSRFARGSFLIAAIFGCTALSLCAAATVASVTETQVYATPAFTDPARAARVQAVLPDLDKIFHDYAAERHLPGMVYGVVLDGRLVHTGATGFANLENKIPAGREVRFRIASMTKSFTAMAVLKLRDEGRLSLQDPLEKYLTDYRAIRPLTKDAPPVTLKHLLTMTAGFPEDNPWGDRQLADTVGELKALLNGGLALSTTPGIGYEYSNLGFALLGQVVAKVPGMPFQDYISQNILQPLGMKDTVWEYTQVPAEKLALGYRWEDNAWKLEPLLHDGTFGAMGGLLTTLDDFSRYVAFHLSAWPARDDPDTGPVRRSTLREMQKPSEISALLVEGQPSPSVNGYGFGLNWNLDARGVVRVGHSGGLPGFGSHYRFCPDYGVAIISFANLTYAPMTAVNNQALALLLDKARLPARTLPVSNLLSTRQHQILELLSFWEPALGDAILAENFFLDRSRESWMKTSRAALDGIGRVVAVGPLVPVNQLRGTFRLEGEKGKLDVFFTLTPESPAKIQQLRLTPVSATQN